jgi:hypothetical protein
MATKQRESAPAEEPGQLVLSNLQITYQLRQLEERAKQLRISISASQRKLHVLDAGCVELPAQALLGGIVIVPESVAAAKVYALPAPRTVATQQTAMRGYEIDVRNDSNYQITLVSTGKHARINGADTIAPNAGSRWYLSVVCAVAGQEAYELIRLT